MKLFLKINLILALLVLFFAFLAALDVIGMFFLVMVFIFAIVIFNVSMIFGFIVGRVLSFIIK